jgi:hypothetical protein
MIGCNVSQYALENAELRARFLAVLTGALNSELSLGDKLSPRE